LFADYSDPDVIRVDDTFYLTASSFNYTPGLPILTSRDLVNWKIVNYALNNIREVRYNIPRHSEGVWAPSIRYHDGTFFIFYGMPDEGYYVVKTKDPLGKWGEPVCILKGKGLIDPCPFWDEDGRAYVVHGYAKSRIGFKSILGIFEISPDGLSVLSEDHFIFNGNDPQHPAVTIEGPKVYKRDGYYYILAPAGGVKDGYQVALRSKDIHGPYEIKTVMSTGNTVINGPHQGGLVDTLNGDEWFIHFQDRGLYGRICHLQPVTWENEWPVIGCNPNEEGIGEPVFEMEKPNIGLKNEEITSLQSSDSFKDGEYGLMWQWLGNHDSSFSSKIPDNDGLRLYALNPSGDKEPIIWNSANVLTQKLVFPVFETEIKMDASGLKTGERAGVIMTGGQYISAYIEKSKNNSFELRVSKSQGDDKDKKEIVISALDVSEHFGMDSNRKSFEVTWKMVFDLSEKVDSEKLYFGNVHEPFTGDNPHLRVYVQYGDSDEYHDTGIDFTPSDHTWVGAKIGIYALGNTNYRDLCGFADFLYVHTKEL
ncbi:MAG: family 43 glycosylhydrolase, partial [Lachnospiraceae bacterium]|nr:family 43 glycosylhydrolase [Lachnospiraceae bacterium]